MMLLGGLGCLAGLVPADTSGNDDFSTAEEITVGTHNGTVSRSTDPMDYYKVDVEIGKYIIFNFTAVQNWEVVVTIYYFVFQEYEPQATSGPLKLNNASWEHRLTRILGYPYPFYILIETKTATTVYNIRIEQYDVPEGSDYDVDKEPGKTYSGVFALFNRNQGIGFDVVNPDLINATLTVENTPDATAVRLTLTDKRYGRDRDDLATIIVSPGHTGTIEYQLGMNTTGRYFCEIDSVNCNYSYSVHLIPQNDGGSGRDAPDVVNETLNDTVLLPGSGVYPGWARDDDITDWFSVNISRGQIIEYKLTTGMADNGTIKLQLYNKDKAPVNATKPLAPRASESGRRITNNLGAGSWYINISGDNDYLLDLTLTDQADGGAVGDAGDTLDTARPVVPQVPYGGLLGNNDTVDHYSFLALADRTYKVNLVLTSGGGVVNASLFDSNMQLARKSEDVPLGTPTTVEFIPAVQGLLYLGVNSKGAEYAFDIVAPSDTDRPAIAITSPANGSSLSDATFDLAGTAFDSTGLLKVEISQSGIDWSPAEGTDSWTYSGLTVGEGISTVWARATDILGNTNTTWIILAYVPGGVKDMENPKVNITSPSNRTMLGSVTFNLTGTASDDFEVFKVEVSLSGIAWWPASGTTNWTYPGLRVEEGISTVYVRATDFAGKTGTASIQVGYSPTGSDDAAPPQISIASPSNGTMLASATFNLAGTASDDFAVVSVEVSLNGIAWLAASGTESWTYTGISVGEGISTVWARATDFSGSAAIAWILVGYRAGGAGDAQKPQISITSPANGTLVPARTFEVAGTASDDFTLSKVEVSQNGIAWLPANGTTSWTFPALAVGEGISTVWARATDFSGNSNTTWILVCYRSAGTADTRKPQLTISSPANGSVLAAATVTVTGTASDDFGVFKIELSLSGIDWWLASGAGPWTYAALTVGEGGNTIWARATDFAGNTNTTSVFVTHIPGGDKVKPVITLTSMKDKAKTGKAKLAVLSGTATDNVAVKKVSLKVNDADVAVTFAGGVWTAINVSLMEGKNTIVVTATDGSGNVQAATFTVNYEKPKAQPGFEAALLAAACLAAAALAVRRKR